jgi:hypothetical protein
MHLWLLYLCFSSHSIGLMLSCIEEILNHFEALGHSHMVQSVLLLCYGLDVVFRFPDGARHFLFSKASSKALELTQPPIECIFPRDKACEAWNCPLTLVQGIHKRMVRFICIYTYKPHHSFVYALYIGECKYGCLRTATVRSTEATVPVTTVQSLKEVVWYWHSYILLL